VDASLPKFGIPTGEAEGLPFSIFLSNIEDVGLVRGTETETETETEAVRGRKVMKREERRKRRSGNQHT